MGIMSRIGVNAVALWIVAGLFSGLSVTQTQPVAELDQLPFFMEAPWAKTALVYLAVGALFGVVNALVKPVVKLFSLPATIFTLGLFAFVVNGAMLMLTSFVSSYLPFTLHINSFIGTAIPAAMVMSVVSMAAGAVMKDRR